MARRQLVVCSQGGVAPRRLGKVVKHLVKVGDAVEAGQGVIVVEAMKMENELRAPGPGTVREIRAPEGAVVAGGAPLVILE